MTIESPNIRTRVPFVIVKRGGAGAIAGAFGSAAASVVAEGEGGGASGAASASDALAASAGVATTLGEGSTRLVLTPGAPGAAHAALASTTSEVNVGAMRVLT